MNQLVEVIKVMAPPGIRWIHRAGLAIEVEKTYNCGTVEVEHFGDLEVKQFQEKYFGAQSIPTVGVCYVAF